MSSVGTYLRELRGRRGVSLVEIARTTRVGSQYLEALETDAFDELPAPVFTRGFIRAYCQALAEPPEEALACYEGREGGTPPPRAPARAAEAEPRARGAVLVSFVLLVVLGMALFTVALVLHPRDRGGRVTAEARPESRPLPSRPEPPPQTRPVLGPLVGAPLAARPAAPPAAAPEAARAPAPAAPTPAAPVPAPAPSLDALAGTVSAPYRLTARTNETTWIRVRMEDGRSIEENVPAGEVREWVSNRPFVLTIGNAGGVSFELNGRALPSLGAKGAVISRIVLPPEVLR